ncbi:hypothetical protein BDZ85DRAFT_266551 [Elsinoe ampelina]|uniref:Phytanoyl-CoA dioxygenase n=1 Tax=Elsinoe ampelina TaxID=302913 RepID=A0A6A6G3V8_9PEZI|nr:hypothetical protein BDZ85DRAFT_266551 [Elsinoe ampelina]
MTSSKYQYLTDEDVAHFLKHGFVRIPACFTKEAAADFTRDVWTRLGVDPNDVSTWNREKVNMPSHGSVKTKEFAPKAWGAMCELLGGEDRIDPESGIWNDGFIVNMGKEEYRGMKVEPKKLDNWHVDGDFFVHFLDSPEQGLLVIPLWTDIVPNGGGTMICSDGIARIAEHLYNNPEGVLPRMQPRDQDPENPDKPSLQWYIDTIQPCSEFHEMTGNLGDVILMHPLMLHSASKNVLRTQRIITNPPVSLKEPFCFDREDGNYSIVEQKTIRDLGGEERARQWKRTRERAAVIPERLKIQNRMMEDEKRRLKEKEMGGLAARKAQVVV